MRKKITFVASLAFAAALCAGVAGASVTAQADTEWANNFKISATAIRTASPAGLRFKVDCPVDYSADDSVEAWTKLTFTSDVEGTEKQYSTNVPAAYWRDASGWNTVLLEIPASDYVTEITAQAFVKVDADTTYESAPVTSSIAKTASKLMNAGETDTAVTKYVAGAVSNITLSDATATITSGETKQLTATTSPAGFDVVWSSDNEAVAKVDNTGKVTALKAGTANITATMGGATATCAVTVNWADKYTFENGVNPVVLNTANTSATGFETVATNNQALAMATGADTYLALDKDWLAAMFADASVHAIAFDVYTTLDGFSTHNHSDTSITYTATNGKAFYTTNASNAAAGGVANFAKASTKQNGYITITFAKSDYTAWYNSISSNADVNALALLLRFGRQDTANSDAKADGLYAYGYHNPGNISIDNVRALKTQARETDLTKGDGTFDNGVNTIVGSVTGQTQVVGMVDVGENNKAVQLYTTTNDLYIGISWDYLTSVFATGATKLTFKVYTAMDGVAKFNGSPSSNLANGTNGFVQTTGGTLAAYGGAYQYGGDATGTNAYRFTILKTRFDAVKTFADGKGYELEYFVLFVRFGLNDENDNCIYGKSSTKKVTTVYVDDFIYA